MYGGYTCMHRLQFLEQVRKLVIIGMFSDDTLMGRLVLKGGNLMDLVFGISARSSLDVDFSIDGDFADSAELLDRIQRSLTSTFAEAGYAAFDFKLCEVPSPISDELKDFWGGYQVEFKLISEALFVEHSADIERIRRRAERVGKTIQRRSRSI
jgi:hypothetical protein